MFPAGGAPSLSEKQKTFINRLAGFLWEPASAVRDWKPLAARTHRKIPRLLCGWERPRKTECCRFFLNALLTFPASATTLRETGLGGWSNIPDWEPFLVLAGLTVSSDWSLRSLFVYLYPPNQGPPELWQTQVLAVEFLVSSWLCSGPWQAERFQSRTHGTTGEERLCLLLQDSLRKGPSKTCLWNLPVSHLQHLPSWLTREVPPRPAFEMHCPWYSHWWPTPLWLVFQRKALSRHPECLPRA